MFLNYLKTLWKLLTLKTGMASEHVTPLLGVWPAHKLIRTKAMSWFSPAFHIHTNGLWHLPLTAIIGCQDKWVAWSAQEMQIFTFKNTWSLMLHLPVSCAMSNLYHQTVQLGVNFLELTIWYLSYYLALY